jgi:hypothetical protein
MVSRGSANRVFVRAFNVSPLTHAFRVLEHRFRIFQFTNCASTIASRVAPHRAGGVAIRSRVREIAVPQAKPPMARVQILGELRLTD